MSGQAPLTSFPRDELDFLIRILQPHEHHLRILFQGLYAPYSPFLSTPFEDTLNLSTAESEAQCFVLLTIYLVAFTHLEVTQSIAPGKKPLRKAVDALLRRAIHTPYSDHLNIFALHNCASFLLLPVDGFVEDSRPLSTPEQENDGLLEFSSDLNPRAAIVTALVVAQQLGYATLASELPSLRRASEADSPPTTYSGDSAGDGYAQAVLCTFTWLALLQFRASIDVAEDRIEWDSLSQFEHDIPRVRIDAMTATLLPPPAFLTPREQSRCCWMAQRAELYGIARDHRHTKRSTASFTKKEAEEQAMSYKKALDEWRYKFNEQMRSMSTEFRKDPRGLGLHRFYSIFSNAEAASLQVAIGSVYHKELVADMRQRLPEPFYRDNIPWKSAATIMLRHEGDQLTKALLINFGFTDAMLKALGLISSLTPVMPQLYDFVSYEESAATEIPSLCIVAPPIIQAGLFAVPLLAAADLRLSVIETWGASASYFNPHLLPLLTNCVKSLRACHVNVNLPGVLKLPFTTANPIADYLQGPFEILMRKIASAEERLQISHVESILNNTFLLSRKKKQIETLAEELAPDTPEMVQSIADSQKIEDEISASMTGSLHVQAIQEIEDTELAVKVFGSDLRQGDVRAIRKASGGSSVTTPSEGGRHRKKSSESTGVGEQTKKSSGSLAKQRTTDSLRAAAAANAGQGQSSQSSGVVRTEPGRYAGDVAYAHHYDDGQMHFSGPPAGYAAQSVPTSHQQQSQPSCQPSSHHHAQQLDRVYSDRPIPPEFPSHAYAHSQVYDSRPSTAQLYDSRPTTAQVYDSRPTTTEITSHAPAQYPSYLATESENTSRMPSSNAHAFSYRSNADPHTHDQAYEPLSRPHPGAKAEVGGYGPVYPSGSEPWSQQQQCAGEPSYPSAPRHFGMDPTVQDGGMYASHSQQGAEYQPPMTGYEQQAMHPASTGAGFESGQQDHPEGSAIWEAWNWAPPAHQQQQHSQQQYRG